MYQRTVVVGHLGNDPTMKYLQDGTPVTTFSLATTRKWNDKAGEKREETTWFRVSVWGKQAEAANQYLSKGKLALVEGTVSATAFKSKQDGEAKASLELRADTVRFLSPKGDSADAGDAPKVAEVVEVPF